MPRQYEAVFISRNKQGIYEDIAKCNEQGMGSTGTDSAGLARSTNFEEAWRDLPRKEGEHVF
jgi:hypothetical protein